MRRIILAANPSHSTSSESDFWKQLERAAEHRGWRLVKHAMRRIPDGPATLVMPARLHDVARFLEPLPLDRAFSLPEWMSQETFNLLLEWEYKRWEITAHNNLTEVGLKKLAWHVDGLYRELQPAITIVTNKIDHGCALFDMAGRHYGSEVVFFERSAADTFFAEPTGMFGESMIWDEFAARDTDKDGYWLQNGEAVTRYIRENPNGFRPQKQKPARAEKTFERAKEAKGPVFFLPMDNTLWTGWAQENHPQKTIDYGEDFPSPSAAINRIAKIVEELGGTLIVKQHPADRERYALEHDNTIVIDTPLDVAMAHADVCISFLTKVAFVSLATEVPTVVIGFNPVAASGAAFYAQSLDEWEPMIRSAAKASAKDIDKATEAFQLFVGWLDSEFFITSGAGLNLAKPNTIRFVDGLLARNLGKTSGSAEMTDRIVADVAARFADKTRWITPEAHPDRAAPPAPLTVLFDASALTESTAKKTAKGGKVADVQTGAADGQARYAEAVFKALSSVDGVELHPVVPTGASLSKRAKSALSKRLGRKVVEAFALEDLSPSGPVIQYSPTGRLAYMPDVARSGRFITVHDQPDANNRSGRWMKDVDTQARALGPSAKVITTSRFTRRELTEYTSLSEDQVFTLPSGSAPIFTRRDPDAVAEFAAEAGLVPDGYMIVLPPKAGSANAAALADSLRDLLSEDGPNGLQFAVMNAMDSGENALGLTHDRVIALEPLSEDARALLYSGARAMICTDLNDALSLPVLDAMACGCPMVASSLGALPEVVGQGGLYVDPRVPAAISRAVTSMAESDTLAGDLSKAALREATGRGWTATALGLVEHFRHAARETVFPGRDAASLYDPPGLPSILDRAAAWRTVSGKLEPTSLHATIDGSTQSVMRFYEGTGESVHVIHKESAVEGGHFKSSVMLKPRERSRAVIFVSQRVGKADVCKAEVYVDLAQGDVLKTRVTKGDALIRHADVVALDDGWMRIDVETLWKESDRQILRLTAGLLSPTAMTMKFEGKGVAGFDLLDARVAPLTELC